jgi:hypothetical protein
MAGAGSFDYWSFRQAWGAEQWRFRGQVSAQRPRFLLQFARIGATL